MDNSNNSSNKSEPSSVVVVVQSDLSSNEGLLKRQSENGLDRDESKSKKAKTMEFPDSDSKSVETGQAGFPKKDILDIAQSLNLNPGSRIQVLWDIFTDDAQQGIQHWWGATLLPYTDGRTFLLADDDDDDDDDDDEKDEGTKDFEVLALRQLEYDACPELGFPDRSIEDVCFLTDSALFNVSTDDTTSWRFESDGSRVQIELSPHALDESFEGGRGGEEDDDDDGDDEISVSSSSPQDGLRTVINTILQGVLVKSGVMEKMAKLPPAQQLIMAERIASSKERLIQKMEEQVSGDGTSGSIVVTPDHVRRCMEELQQELSM